MKASVLIENLQRLIESEGDIEIIGLDSSEMDGPDLQVVKSHMSDRVDYTIWGGVNPGEPFFRVIPW